MNFTTRRPSGQTAWPMILLAGIEGAGKTYAAAEATGLPMFGRSFFIEIGERSANEYGAIPGANYEIIDHDGTEDQIARAAQWAAQQPTVDGKPSLLILDSMTELWQLNQDEIQAIADRRHAQKGRRGDASPTMDLWHRAKDRFHDVVNAARRFPGPVIMTARLDNVSVVEGGQPTGEKVWKIRAEKNLSYAATVIVQAREPRQWTLTKASSLALQLPPEGAMKWPGFTIEELLVRMELDPATIGDSGYVRPIVTVEPVAAVAPDGVQPIPGDLAEQLKAAEERLDLAAVADLGALVSANERAGVQGARVMKARAEQTWKRVKARLDAGETTETAPNDPSTEPSPTPPESSTTSDSLPEAETGE